MTVRVLMVIPSFVPAPGGTQRFVYELASHLNDKDVTICAVTTNLWWAGPESHAMLEPGIMQRSDASAGYPIIRIVPRLIRGYPLFFGFECAGYTSTFDIIHIHGTLGILPYYLPLFLVGHVFGKNVIVTIHMVFSPPRNRFNSFLNILGLFLLNFCDKVTVVSPSDALKISKFLRNRDKLELTLPGVDYSSEPSLVMHTSGEVSERYFNLLTVGSLNKTKGIDVGIRATKILSNHKNIRYSIVGPDVGEGKALGNLVRELDLSDRVHFVGYVLNRAELRMHYANADVVVIPSIYETTPLVALEAMAVGKPIVASRVGGIPFLIRDEWNGLLVEPSSPQALANAIERLVDDETLRKTIASRALQSAKEYDWDKVSNKFVLLYRQSSSIQTIGS
jgi:glycosyltransferase involved in cell wall biosynthesis